MAISGDTALIGWSLREFGGTMSAEWAEKAGDEGQAMLTKYGM